MKKFLKKVLLKTPIVNSLVLDKMMEIPHGEKGVQQVGHRVYVGGLWEEMGNLQFEMLKSQGLQPGHTFRDVACGSLRLGNLLIDYLESGNYQGIDKEQSLIEQGSKEEVGQEKLEAKKPEFVVSDSFEFGKFSKKSDYGIAQSLFTHLPGEMIDDCFQKLFGTMNPGGQFFATYFESEGEFENYEIPHDHARFYFTREEMLEFGTKHGWEAEYIGEWDHPRDQVLVKYTVPQ